jgi:hypothetical protein
MQVPMAIVKRITPTRAIMAATLARPRKIIATCSKSNISVVV